jgi:hypothetical protein
VSKFFSVSPFLSQDRDQVEDAELAARAAQEPMPRNVQDFKDHPLYALERHLRKNEVIHPKTAIGTVAAGTTKASSSTTASTTSSFSFSSPTAFTTAAAKGRGLERIYRRRDVHIVRSADAWYRLGRDVKVRESPHFSPLFFFAFFSPTFPTFITLPLFFFVTQPILFFLFLKRSSLLFVPPYRIVFDIFVCFGNEKIYIKINKKAPKKRKKKKPGY